ncbi:hypothetical protein [Ramlibacter sp.]|uniref:hypothetical protein n=1 Tax=Ramlibacter sp. TaxID=1917967 RepID=UPI0035ADFA95
MQRELVPASRSLGGTSDLTLLAPIRPGFVPSLESVTYTTRVRRTLDALHGARQAAHEHALARLLSDAVERVGVIHSVRVAVLAPQGQVLLAVTFDGSHDAYIRVLWQEVGPLLDLIFCSTVDYVTSHDHGFEAWLAWARRVQVETGFFYGPPDATARDVVVHRRLERMRRRGPTHPADEWTAVAPSAEAAVRNPYGARPDDPPVPPLDEYAQARELSEQTRHGLQALAGLYRLTDLYRPGTPDGITLRLAGINLLREFVALYGRGLPDDSRQEARNRFARQLDWLFPPLPDGAPGGADRHDVEPRRERPPLQPLDEASRADIQGGILRGYEGTTHGLLVLLAFDHAEAAARFIDAVRPTLTADAHDHAARAGTVFANLAFTPAGLRACGLDDDTLDLFPEDFRQGMAARAGLLGDVRVNHPRRWRLPRVFIAADQPPGEAQVDLAAVHAVLQWRCLAAPEAQEAVHHWDAGHPLQELLRRLAASGIAGLRILAVQSMKRQQIAVDGEGAPRVVEHFGYADGEGQPDVLGTRADPLQRVPLGEVLAGWHNVADVVPLPDDPGLSTVAATRLGWLRNGSFLALRQYRQDVAAFRAAVHAAAQVLHAEAGLPDLASAREVVLAKLMGRYPDGRPLVPRRRPGGLNDFDYRSDPHGEACPLHAHIRRAHPREAMPPGARPPRLMRRGMSWGPSFEADPQAERGLVFMAYNASLGEQFEVVQRWLVGGNSTGASSRQACPIVGVAESGEPRVFPFVQRNGAARVVGTVRFEEVTPPFDEPASVTRLDWGLYLFTPSLGVVARLGQSAWHAARQRPAAVGVPWQIARGRALLAHLQRVGAEADAATAIEAWKAAIEDPEAIDRLEAAALWAAIREDHGGVLRTPYGVLVASRALLQQVFRDRDRCSVSGQRRRMQRSIGDIALGFDGGSADGHAYWRAADPINAAIAALDPEGVFQLARAAATHKLDAIVDEARRQAQDTGAPSFQVQFDAREVVDEVLADLAEAWFGLRDGPHFARGGTDWAWREGERPLYPGHFTALSRYMFQPHPGPVPRELGERYGQALTRAMRQWVDAHRAAGTVPQAPGGGDAPITAAAWRHPHHADDPQFIASTLVGVLMGFTPTIIGAVLNVLREWHRDGAFARLRSLHAGQAMATLATLADARALLHEPMAAAARMRPMPQIGWREARQAFVLGEGAHAVTVQPGERIVTAMVSGTQESLVDGLPDGRLMFGGVREEGPGHPTHACPGYHQGIAAMLGTLAALVGRAEDLRALPQPQVFEVRGELRRRASPLPSPGDDDKRLWENAAACPVPLPAPGTRQGLVIAWGDSWLGYVLGRIDLQDALRDFGYDAPDDYCRPARWLRVADMAARIADFRQDLQDRYLPEGLRSIVLSGGGNDSVNSVLKQLVRPCGTPGAAVDRAALRVHLEGIAAHYRTLIRGIRTLPNGQPCRVPVLLHGYDHPVPVDKGFPQWLRHPFHDLGYRDPAAPDDRRRVDVAATARIMRTLIDRLNITLMRVAREFDNVHHVDLRGTAARLAPADPAAGWLDNMHPSAAGFRCMAARIAEVVEAAPPA